MNRVPRLIATVSSGSQGLRRLGAAMAEADARLDRLSQTDSAGFEVPDGWAALLGAAQIDDERLRRDPATTRADDVSARVIDEGARAEPEAVLRRAAAAPPGAPTPTPAPIRPVTAPRSTLEETPHPTQNEDNRRSLTASAPRWPQPSRNPMAAVGAEQRLVQRPAISRFEPMEAINGPTPTHTPPSGPPPALPTPQDQRMARVLDRIAGSGLRSRPAPGGPSRDVQTAPSTAIRSDAPPRTALAASGPATPIPARPAPLPPPTAIHPEEPEATSGLSRLLARGRALGVAPPSLSGAGGQPTAAAPAIDTAPAPDWPMTATHRPPSAPAVARPSPIPPASPAAIEAPPTARPLARDRLARDLAELLRREARAAGIDLDGGAP